LIGWQHSTGSKYNAPEHFIINYKNTETDQVQEIKVGNNTREVLITELLDGTEYKFAIFAENLAGRSEPSRPKIARTYGKH
jgi:hypothetical protein